jgi:hypothetical protein
MIAILKFSNAKFFTSINIETNLKFLGFNFIVIIGFRCYIKHLFNLLNFRYLNFIEKHKNEIPGCINACSGLCCR